MTDPIQVHSQGTDPSFSGAIVALMRSLQSAFAPRSLTQRGAYLNNRIEGPDPAEVPTAPSSPAGPITKGAGLGNQSPSLGNSW